MRLTFLYDSGTGIFFAVVIILEHVQAGSGTTPMDRAIALASFTSHIFVCGLKVFFFPKRRKKTLHTSPCSSPITRIVSLLFNIL
ncbi:ORF194 [White spot syndrome virus]|uniref:ORF194 n=1 Tax=White spot syndrome virus TaxID=342409 RepID=A0A2D3I5X9_9VIRU|nr:ORF194 [White spot syndrome virus]